jgi:hypothetical protein
MFKTANTQNTWLLSLGGSLVDVSALIHVLCADVNVMICTIIMMGCSSNARCVIVWCIENASVILMPRRHTRYDSHMRNPLTGLRQSFQSFFVMKKMLTKGVEASLMSSKVR